MKKSKRERLVILPLYNEEKNLVPLVKCLARNYGGEVLFIDDGSTDDSGRLLQEAVRAGPELGLGINVISHDKNEGYGKSLVDGFDYGRRQNFDALLTMDCDWQHQPSFIHTFFNALKQHDVVSGSRYLSHFDCDSPAPPERAFINQKVTEEINRVTNFGLTDSFCGFKAYTSEALSDLELDEPGYAMPIQFWLQAYYRKLDIKEMPVPRLYPEPRSFGGALEDPQKRLRYYLTVLEREKRRWTGRQANAEHRP